MHITFASNLLTSFSFCIPNFRIMIAAYNHLCTFYVITITRTHWAIADHDDLITWLKIQKLRPSDFAENVPNTESNIAFDYIIQ